MTNARERTKNKKCFFKEKTDIEKLIDKLIELWRKPFGYHEWKHWYNAIEYFNNELILSFGEWAWKFIKTYSLRNISSIDSWLWQFVCENGMVDINYWNIREYYSEQENWWIYLRRLNGEDNYEYRLIESALCDEDKLEEFLLDNIKIDE